MVFQELIGVTVRPLNHFSMILGTRRDLSQLEDGKLHPSFQGQERRLWLLHVYQFHFSVWKNFEYYSECY